MTTFSSWVMSDGRRGIVIQAEALAEAMGLHPIMKTISPSFPWSHLPPSLCFNALASVKNNPDPITPPWPDILITCGRQAVAISCAIRKASKRKTFTIHIQDPKCNPQKFDLIIAPLHDKMQATNVLNTLGSMHRINPSFLAQEAETVKHLLHSLPKPWIGVIIGGVSKHHHFDTKTIEALSHDLLHLHKIYGGSLLLTPSRRTPPDLIQRLKKNISSIPHYLWDGKDPNPYFGILGLSDYLIVTCDSVNMATEAAASGKPLYIYHFDKSPPKFIQFHDALRKRGISRKFEGILESWNAQPLLEIQEIAAKIWKAYHEKTRFLGAEAGSIQHK